MLVQIQSHRPILEQCVVQSGRTTRLGREGWGFKFLRTDQFTPRGNWAQVDKYYRGIYEM